MECKFGKSHMPPNCSHVIRDHRVTKGVTSRTKPVLNLPSLQTRVGEFHLPSPSPRASRCSSCPPPPRVLHQHPALRQRPWPLRAGSTPPHAALAPLTLRAGSTPAHAGSTPAHAGSAPPPVRRALGRCPRPLRTGSASPTLRAVWMHPAPASAPVLVLVPPR